MRRAFTYPRRYIISQYFYDSQCRRFLTQFIAILSNFDVQYGSDPKGNPILHRVPVVWGDQSRQAATVVSNNSASALPSAPLMTVYVTGMEYDQRRTQDPYFLDKVNVRQRTMNQQTGEYETTQGNAFTVERIMPVPYTMRVTVDVWTTSQQQKYEIFEQLMVLFNPSMEINSTDNFLDWTSLSVIYQDGINWSSKSVPQGTSNAVDVMTLKFYMPIWISSPIKVKKLGMIQKIITSIHKGSAIEDMANDSLLLGTRQKITPYGYKLLLIGNKLQVLPANEVFVPSNNDFELPLSGPNTDVYWQSFLNVYGVVKPGVSMIAIENPYLETEIRGTIEFDPLDDRLLTYTIDTDTLPQNTLVPVDSIVDPNTKWPDNGLLPVSVGQRYLIVTSIPQQLGYPGPASAGPNWIGLTQGASSNDIIEYVAWMGADLSKQCYDRPSGASSGQTVITLNDTVNVAEGFEMFSGATSLGIVTYVDHNNDTVTIDTPLAVALAFGDSVSFRGEAWAIAFEASANGINPDYVTNNTSGVQYMYVDGDWRKAWEGWIDQGSFRIIV